MNVAILHFHLRRGGVTSVIHKQISSLAMTVSSPHIAVLAGTKPEASLSVPFFLVPSLDYDSFTGHDKNDLEAGAIALAQEIAEALSQAFPTGCDLLHVHNPLLCKNARLVGALNLIQTKGQKLLVQVHDLAEDFRPQVYEGIWPYPRDCDYVVINQRDQKNLIASGLAEDGVHFLPNPVTSHEDYSIRERYSLESQRDRRSVLYPVRGIRRKNLGEALLLSQFLPKGAHIAVTLPPTSPGDWELYNSWKTLAAERSFHVKFEQGNTHSLSDLYHQAFCVLTTSVKEGFGYSYLDPLVRGLPVKGREIPYVVEDFSQKGIHFPGLYTSLGIPKRELSHFSIDQKVRSHLSVFRRHYGTIFKPGLEDRFESLLDSLSKRFHNEVLDFGSLDEGLQSSVLIRIHGDPGFRREIEEMNPFLLGYFEETEGNLQKSREGVLSGYGEEAYGKKLVSIYHQAVQSRYRGMIDKVLFLSLYLKPEGFFMVAS